MSKCRDVILASSYFAALGAHASEITLTSKVYGKLNVSTQIVYDHESDEYYNELVNNASRFGIKGASPTAYGDLVYQVELGFRASGVKKSSDQVLSQRNTFIGISGQYGELIAGRMDSPTKVAGFAFSLPNDAVGSIENIMVGEYRLSNMLKYSSPSYHNISFQLATIASDLEVVKSDSTKDIDAEKTSRTPQGYSASIKSSFSHLDIIVAADIDIKGMNNQRFVMHANIWDDIHFNYLFQHASSANKDYFVTNKSSVYSHVANVTAPYKKATLKLQYATSEANETLISGQQISFITEYALTKASKAFIHLTQLKSDNKSQQEYLGLGLEHVF